MAVAVLWIGSAYLTETQPIEQLEMMLSMSGIETMKRGSLRRGGRSERIMLERVRWDMSVYAYSMMTMNGWDEG